MEIAEGASLRLESPRGAAAPLSPRRRGGAAWLKVPLALVAAMAVCTVLAASLVPREGGRVRASEWAQSARRLAPAGVAEAGRRSAPSEDDSTVHVLEEGTLVQGALLMRFEDFDELMMETVGCATEAERYGSGRLCGMRYNVTRRCSWCARSGECIAGEFLVNGGSVTGNQLTANEMELFFAGGHDFATPSEHEKQHPRPRPKRVAHTVQSIAFACRLERALPLGVPGAMVIPWARKAEPQGSATLQVSSRLQRRAPEGLVVAAAPAAAARASQAGSRSQVAVCGRGLYGAYPAATIERFVEFHAAQGFGRVYMYDVGLATVRDRARLEPLVASGHLRLVDLRAEMQELYGTGAQGALMRTFAVGQMWLKFDCLARARAEGFAWALHTDQDEYVMAGARHAGGTPPQPPRAADVVLDLLARNHSSWLSLGSLTVPEDDAFCSATARAEHEPAAPRHALRPGFWDAFRRFISARHVAEERRDDDVARSLFANDPRVCPDYRMCLRSQGMRKLVTSTSLDPTLLRVHHVAASLAGRGEDVSVDELYVRHYRCLNRAPRALTAI